MNTSTNNTLECFFSCLLDANIPIVVLRGYELLPAFVKTDIDAFVDPSNIIRFESVFEFHNEFDLQKYEVRLGLNKYILTRDTDIIELDIVYGFYYAGLYYVDTRDVMSYALVHESNLFLMPRVIEETAISLLKEVLHNGKLRCDKKDYYLDLIPKVLKLNQNLIGFLTEAEVRNMLLSIYNNAFDAMALRKSILWRLLKNNLKHKGLLYVLKNFFLHFKIKYLVLN
jgi:hypothetical protein